MLKEWWRLFKYDYYELLQGSRRWMMILLLSPIWGSLLILMVFLATWKANVKPINHFLNRNNIEVKVQDADLEAIRINWNIEYVSPQTIYDNQKVTLSDFQELGNNYFSIFYEDSLIAKVVHYKEEKISKHEYLFSIFDKDNCIEVDLEVIGNSDSIRWVSGCQKAR